MPTFTLELQREGRLSDYVLHEASQKPADSEILEVNGESWRVVGARSIVDAKQQRTERYVCWLCEPARPEEHDGAAAVAMAGGVA